MINWAAPADAWLSELSGEALAARPDMRRVGAVRMLAERLEILWLRAGCGLSIFASIKEGAALMPIAISPINLHRSCPRWCRPG